MRQIWPRFRDFRSRGRLSTTQPRGVNHPRSRCKGPVTFYHGSNFWERKTFPLTEKLCRRNEKSVKQTGCAKCNIIRGANLGNIVNWLVQEAVLKMCEKLNSMGCSWPTQTNRWRYKILFFKNVDKRAM